jgi:hypothetical protein
MCNGRSQKAIADQTALTRLTDDLLIAVALARPVCADQDAQYRIIEQVEIPL